MNLLCLFIIYDLGGFSFLGNDGFSFGNGVRVTKFCIPIVVDGDGLHSAALQKIPLEIPSFQNTLEEPIPIFGIIFGM